MVLLSRCRLIFILVLGLLPAALLLNGHLVPAGDNATYMILGQSLVTGNGYKMISDPRLPEMALYPPGYPLLLAGVLTLTGTAYDLIAAILPIKLLSIVLYLGAIVLAYDMLRQRSSTLASMTALLMAVNSHVLHFATEVGTEIPYLFFSLCCLWLFERYWQEPHPQGVRLLWVAVLSVLTFYVRSIALVMAAAFTLYLFHRGRFTHALLLLFVVGILVVPWFIRNSLLPDTGTSVGLGQGYFALYFSTDPYGTGRASLSDWVARLAQNLRIYTWDIWPDVLFPHALSADALIGFDVFAGVISGLLLLGFILEARHGHVSEWYVVIFFASCVGYLWAQSRLIVPIIPFVIYYLLVAVNFLLQRILLWGQQHNLAPYRSVKTYALTLLCAVLMLSALVVDIRRIQQNLRYGLGHSLATYYAGDAEWSNYLRAIDWVVQDTRERSVVMCRKPDLLYILTGHQALEYPYSVDAAELMRTVRDNHVAYVIEDAFSWTRTTAQYLQPALQVWQAAEPEALSLVYETDAPRTRVWRVNKLN